MSDDAAQFSRDVAALDDVTPLQTGATVHVYAARLAGTTKTGPDGPANGQPSSRSVRLFTPAPGLSGQHYDRVVDALSAWSEMAADDTITAIRGTGDTPRPWLTAAAEGRPLTETAPLSVDQTRSVLAAVSEALRHAETAGYSWVPVEPGDVRVSPDDTTAASLDWPVDPSRWDSESTPQTASGDTGNRDESSVVRLGAIAYYALTGQQPTQSDGETAGGRVPSPSAVDGAVPSQFDAVVERALHSDPDQRYESPYAFKRAVLFESQQPGASAPTNTPATGPASGETATTGQKREDGPPEPAGETATGPSQSHPNVSRRAMLGAVGLGAAVTTVGGTWFAATRVFGSTEERFPMFRYDAANTGYVANGVGPTDGVTALWRVDTGAPVASSPVVSEETVFINDRDGQFYALDAVGGMALWSEDTNRSLPVSATLSEDRVHLSEQEDQDTAVTARGMATGTRYWSKNTNEINSFARAVAFDDGDLYTLGEGGIQVHDTETGDEQWLSSRVSVSSLTAAVRNDTLYFGGNRTTEQADNGRQSVIAFDTDEQEVRWSVETNGPITSSPAVTDGVVYAGSNDTTVYALNAEDGTERWQFGTGGPLTSSPAVTDHQGGTVYIGGTDRRVHAIDTSDGTERWQFEAENSIISSPAVASDTVYVGSQDRNVYAIDAETGDQRWVFEGDGPIISSPAVVSNRVFIGTEAGTIYALTEP